MVTAEKKVVIFASRLVNELGKGAPDSKTFQKAVKQEFGMTMEMKDNFHFFEEESKPRVLVGLKSGHLLTKMLEPEDLVQINMKMPIFSPDLKVWRTSLLEKLLVTGTIGVNPDLVEREYNFPHFKLLCPENETETELIERVEKSGKELLNVLES